MYFPVGISELNFYPLDLRFQTLSLRKARLFYFSWSGKHPQHVFESLTKIWLRSICSKFKGTVMQIEKTLINDRLHVSKVSRKFDIPTIYNFAVICT